MSLLTGGEELGKDVAVEVEDSVMLLLFDSDLKERAWTMQSKSKQEALTILVITSIIHGSTLVANDKPLHDKNPSQKTK